jgi:O-antigen ligase
VEQARVLLGHISERPLFGWGFGSVAPDYKYGQIPSYELAYLDLLYKTGIIGLLLWLSWPIRLLFDLVKVRLGRLHGPDGLDPRAAAVPIAVIVSVMVTGSLSPYLLASYGLLTILWPVAWLEPSLSRTVAGERPTTR